MAQALSEADQLALLDVLADGQWHSGETLALRFGISRAALAKRIDRLSEWQLGIESRQGLGYRLPQPLERLDAARLQAALPGLRVAVLPTTDSTNSRLGEASPEQDPQALLAEFQSAGRGRRGRQWISPFGANLYLSLAWSWPAWPPQLGALPLAVGLACARSLRRAGLESLRLKWPNDLVVDGRKLGGILLEHRGEGGGGCRVVAGVGINLRMSAAAEGTGAIAQPWINLDAALAAAGRPPASRNALAIDLLGELRALFEAYPAGGFSALRAEWSALDLSLDRPVDVLLGEQRLAGVARGVDEQGALLLETGAGIQALHAGEISLRLAAA